VLGTRVAAILDVVGTGLVRRGVRGHEQHALEPELAARVAGEGEVPEMGRVEGPAEDAERALAGVRSAVGRGRALTRGRVRRLRRGT